MTLGKLGWLVALLVSFSAQAAPFAVPGFACSAPDPIEGTTCVGRLGDYPQDVAIIVPVAYHPRARADLVLHLHGFNLDGHSMSYLLKYFGFAHVMAVTRRDAILVAPLSYGRCDDFNDSLADRPEHFKSFIDAALAKIQAAGLAASAEPGVITLTGHSGAYLPLSRIIHNGVYADRIRELYLLDATYGEAEAFERFAADDRHRFWSAYHTTDDSMAQVNPEIMAYLKQHGIAYYESPGPEVIPVDAISHRIGFVVSDVRHDPTFAKYFAELLAF